MNITDLIHHIENKIKHEIKRETVRNQYAWWLLEKLTNQSKADLILKQQIELTTEQQQQLDQWLDQIDKQHKPIAYILGTVPFGPLSIIVQSPVLIPRPETEEWALQLAEQLKASGAKKLSILDLGAGTGCIALLFAHILPDAHIYATDICPDAITLAEQNKEALNIDTVTVHTSDLFNDLPKNITFDLVVSNPPYISPQEYAQLAPSITQWEHKHALIASDEGLFFIRHIIKQAPQFLKPNDILQEHNINQLYIEIGWQQGQTVRALMQDHGYTNIIIHKDSAGKDRIVSGRLASDT